MFLNNYPNTYGGGGGCDPYIHSTMPSRRLECNLPLELYTQRLPCSCQDEAQGIKLHGKQFYHLKKTWNTKLLMISLCSSKFSISQTSLPSPFVYLDISVDIFTLSVVCLLWFVYRSVCGSGLYNFLTFYFIGGLYFQFNFYFINI